MGHHQVRRGQLEQQVEEVVCLRRNTRVMRETLIDCEASVDWYPSLYFLFVWSSEIYELLRLATLERFLVIEVDIISQHLGMVFEHSELWHRYCVCAIFICDGIWTRVRAVEPPTWYKGLKSGEV